MVIMITGMTGRSGRGGEGVGDDDDDECLMSVVVVVVAVVSPSPQQRVKGCRTQPLLRPKISQMGDTPFWQS